MSDASLRFGGLARLYGATGLERLTRAHVCVIGIGGVGSWTVEALARSGVGRLTLIDLDDVCVSNVNRQLHALEGTVGRPKIEVMAERCRAINPDCLVQTVPEFFTELTADEILKTRFDCVVDAIDQVGNKTLLIAKCRQKEIPIVSAGAAGGRRDPSAVQSDDLARAAHDPLLREVRKKLREEHGFERDPKALFGVPCVFSNERATPPPEGCSGRITCDNGYGTASFVTGVFGLAAAGCVVTRIAGG